MTPTSSRYFYPRPPRGGRPLTQRLGELASQFLSTPSARRATYAMYKSERFPNISIHALREEGDIPRNPEGEGQTISIHALREEGDLRVGALVRLAHISIHALREEGDSKTLPRHRRHWQFLSTPSARRATPAINSTDDATVISIHALREEGDQRRSRKKQSMANFYPRPPRGGRPKDAKIYNKTAHFYPRPPRGGRPGWF